jgi:hypothetical protein
MDQCSNPAQGTDIRTERRVVVVSAAAFGLPCMRSTNFTDVSVVFRRLKPKFRDICFPYIDHDLSRPYIPLKSSFIINST